MTRWRQCATGVLWYVDGGGEVFQAIGPLRGDGYLERVTLQGQGFMPGRVVWGAVLSGVGEATVDAFAAGESLIHRSQYGRLHGQPAGFVNVNGTYPTRLELPVYRRIDSGSRYVVVGVGVNPLTYDFGLLITVECAGGL